MTMVPKNAQTFSTYHSGMQSAGAHSTSHAATVNRAHSRTFSFSKPMLRHNYYPIDERVIYLEPCHLENVKSEAEDAKESTNSI